MNNTAEYFFDPECKMQYLSYALDLRSSTRHMTFRTGNPTNV